MRRRHVGLLLNRMVVTIVTIDSRPLESSLAVAALSLGVWLSLPFDTFSSSSAFATMRDVASEGAWSAVLIFVGVIKLIAVHANRLALRRTVNRLALAVWLFVDVSIWLAGSQSSAAAVYLVFVLMSIWVNLALSIKRVHSSWASINQL